MSENASRRPEPAAPVYGAEATEPTPPAAAEESSAAVDGAGTVEGLPAAAQPGAAAPAANGESKPLPVEGKGPKVAVAEFEGPLDLLLYLIHEEELDIGDIPIARITDQYLESIQDLTHVDLDLAGEYLVMATTLMRIKAKMLLPRDPEDEDADEIDERAELVRRLLEYREYKRVAEDLGERQDEWRSIFRRAASPIPEPEREDAEDDLGIELMDLFRAFRDIVARAKRETTFAVETEEYSIEEQMDFIRGECGRFADGVPFHRLFEGQLTRSLLITTFLALLEMVRMRELVANQVDSFGEIWLRRATEVETPHEA